MNSIQKHEFERLLKRFMAAEKIVDSMNIPQKILTSTIRLNDCELKSSDRFVVRKSEYMAKKASASNR